LGPISANKPGQTLQLYTSPSSAPASRASVVAPVVPSWVPANFDWKKLTEGIRQVIREQGAPLSSFVPGRVKDLLITDADHTLLKTAMPIFVKRRGGGLLRDVNGKLVVLGLKSADYIAEFEALKKSYPNELLELDFSEYGSTNNILNTREIQSTLRELRMSDLGGDDKREFVITARANDTVVSALDEYLAERRVTLDGVFATNNPAMMAQLGLGGISGTAKRKALIMAGLAQVYGLEKVPGASLKFIDDTDENLVSAMQLLPRMFPKMRFEFQDVVHVGSGRYVQQLVGQTGKDGQLQGADGLPLTDAQIAAYHSNDAPFPWTYRRSGS
jgi:hypothetical protein